MATHMKIRSHRPSLSPQHKHPRCCPAVNLPALSSLAVVGLQLRQPASHSFIVIVDFPGYTFGSRQRNLSGILGQLKTQGRHAKDLVNGMKESVHGRYSVQRIIYGVLCENGDVEIEELEREKNVFVCTVRTL